eukprot:TRINITY_DN15531_c0_g1::TRINITY_DN15531_c0_g1_i1::g.28554::m.28554 TRINITY_DN15531_c0_g1::TRINITY_DN15531_c0_g1_i1::g.28554  ORF type:complete len:504 (+),score=56.80,sp/F4J6F6/IREH1_ARATH/38.67/6e-27,sp/F4J6F6/IREH1_ARATH/35.20/4e-20,Pkinase/PF00069.20/1.9e-39,Pkinase/PF00069.20/1.3e-19,Pkinase_Tyr/PF07714.12/9.6e-27,Pkinase_Tyr/PF07714.12/3.8e-09,APH/PF01636.18/6.5,APH/PF01636.18/0.0022,Kinase-like/PF14531.1/4.3e+02,Kinase-like/PF14531.1/0.02,Kinase-like/PF14531.1/1.6e+03,Kinase-like/PF14531.1/
MDSEKIFEELDPHPLTVRRASGIQRSVSTIVSTPSRLSEFIMLEKLGQGGYGSVFLAKLKTSDALFAIKKMEVVNEEAARELELLTQLHHPYIVRYYYSIFEAGCVYFVMEYLEGGTLSELIQEYVLDDNALRYYAIQLGQALDYLHCRGIVHRDVKPDNVMINKEGISKLLDFGLAQKMPAKKSRRSRRSQPAIFPRLSLLLEKVEIDPKPVTNPHDSESVSSILSEEIHDTSGEATQRRSSRARSLFQVVPKPVELIRPELYAQIPSTLNEESNEITDSPESSPRPMNRNSSPDVRTSFIESDTQSPLPTIAVLQSMQSMHALQALHQSQSQSMTPPPPSSQNHDNIHTRLFRVGGWRGQRGQKRESCVIRPYSLLKGGCKGTPYYMAPEVIKQEAHGPACDWWAFGITLYECLTGNPPFLGDNPREIFHYVCESAVSWESAPPDTDPAFKDLIEKLLEKKPTRRLGADIGVTSLFMHPFFSCIDWDHVHDLEPPFMPESQ